ncbi:hypothetical protein F511_33572 [Dorcoceras hygrometricum]|uniref:Uncharacterized protein n=1 Tax=Dorcoceras hygrometricum TaxID=472368 RepID=A0A2Z7AKW1_9LAMI|nr:hypothetical protein F511_33572 [Dorcoceras hygrometricum]
MRYGSYPLASEVYENYPLVLEYSILVFFNQQNRHSYQNRAQQYQMLNKQLHLLLPTHEMWELPTPLIAANKPSREMRYGSYPLASEVYENYPLVLEYSILKIATMTFRAHRSTTCSMVTHNSLGTEAQKTAAGSYELHQRYPTSLTQQKALNKLKVPPPLPPFSKRRRRRPPCAAARRRRKFVSCQLDEENPFVQNSSVLLVQPDEGTSVLVVDRIGDYLPQSTEKSRVLVIPVGARHKCQQGIRFERSMYDDY